jgi:hypothetical protein
MRRWQKFWLKFLLILTITLFLTPFCLFGASAAYLLGGGEIVARSKIPPQYPNSRLLSVEEDSYSDGAAEYQTYETTDPLENVIQYMEQYYPNFKESRRRDITGPVYFNGWEFVASLTIYIYQNPIDPQKVIIEVVIVWPHG